MTHADGGTEPVWDQTFAFRRVPLGSTITFKASVAQIFTFVAMNSVEVYAISATCNTCEGIEMRHACRRPTTRTSSCVTYASALALF